MPKQPANYIQRDILIDELHPQSMPKLMRLNVIQPSRLVTDLLLVGPFIENASKRCCLEWKLMRSGTWEQVLAGVSPLLTDILLLCLNRRYHCLIHQGNDMFLLGLPLVKVEIPFVAIIMDQARKPEGTDFANAQSPFEKDHNHT